MKRVRQKGTNLEQLVRQALTASGAHYRLNVQGLPGRPDIANKRRKKAIFVHGCFWHHHTGCRRGRIPAQNREFWAEKLRKNVERDQLKARALDELGFEVLILWECEMRDVQALGHRLRDFWFG
jgi:DNA mismatch endonuclease, patch repair protein